MKLNAIFLLNILMALSSTVWATNYCNPRLCQGGRHIACGADYEFGANCPNDAKMAVINKKLQDMIVSDINKYRNLIAGGEDPQHNPACRMATIQWDNELAQLAELNVKQCFMQHDVCHNTDAFKYSGQNLAMMSSTGPMTFDVQSEIKTSIKMWYDEVENSDMSYIRKFRSTSSRYGVIGHFTILVNEKNTRVGCAASMYDNDFLFACNFATTNMMNFPVYKDCAQPASDCNAGTNRYYPNLCSTAEQYDVNKFY